MTGLPNRQEGLISPFGGFLHAPRPLIERILTSVKLPAVSGCIEETRRIIEKQGAETTLAFFIESIQRPGGVNHPASPAILVVADEVITVFERFGDWFASNLWNVDPDLICLAKGLTSGYLSFSAAILSTKLRQQSCKLPTSPMALLAVSIPFAPQPALATSETSSGSVLFLTSSIT
jgi:putrescine aminotransferase